MTCLLGQLSRKMEFVLQASEKPKFIDKYYLLHNLSLGKLKRTK